MKCIYTIKPLEDNKWLIEGEKWDNCYCDKEPFSITLEKYKKPVRRDFIYILQCDSNS